MNPPNCASLFGACQGLNPPVNRPIVASVVPPELRGQAFAIFLTIFETIGWAVFALGAGRVAASVGIQTVFLWVLVGLMLVNAAVLSTLYVCYPRDVRKVTATSNTAGRKHSRTPDPPPLQYRSSVLERWRREGERGAIHAGIRSTTARHERIRRCVRAAAVVLAQSVRSR